MVIVGGGGAEGGAPCSPTLRDQGWKEEADVSAVSVARRSRFDVGLPAAAFVAIAATCKWLGLP